MSVCPEYLSVWPLIHIVSRVCLLYHLRYESQIRYVDRYILEPWSVTPCYGVNVTLTSEEAQWLSGRVLDSRPRGSRFKPRRPHCVLSLSKTHLSVLSTGSTQEDPYQHY